MSTHDDLHALFEREWARTMAEVVSIAENYLRTEFLELTRR